VESLRARIVMILLIATVVWSGAVTGPSVTTAQSRGGPEELWEEYPLEERADPRPAPTPTAAPEKRPAATRPATAMDDGWSIAVLLVGALGAFLIGALLPQLRRSDPVPVPAAPARSRVTPRRFTPSTDEKPVGDRASHGP
jgi:hypothetical protein